MKTIGIFYGSTSGKTIAIIDEIEFCLKKIEHKVFNVKDGVENINMFENIILVTPTYGVGELQKDWENNLEALEKINFEGKKVALVGLGNQLAFGESFIGGIRILYDLVKKNGATVIGMTSVDGYRHKESEAQIEDMFVGLALDEMNDDDETPDRIFSWVKTIIKEFN
ncbi:MAG: flavodoxin [Fusobacteriaceae bacterium]